MSEQYLEESLEPGARVEVRARFEGHWARGFEVIARDPSGYRVRRLSDGATLPVLFEPADLRPERKRQGMWWY